jgi:hypothetical protein
MPAWCRIAIELSAELAPTLASRLQVLSDCLPLGLDVPSSLECDRM